MKYYFREIINGDPNAGSKARNDISDILQMAGWTPIVLNFRFDERASAYRERNLVKKISENLRLRREWNIKLKLIQKDDIVVIQFPVLRHPVLLYKSFLKVKKRGGKLILLIHDLELLRYSLQESIGILKKLRISFEEKSVLKCADKIIVHNKQMKAKMQELGFSSDKLIELGIFDYLIPDFKFQTGIGKVKYETVAIAGTLRPHKTKYLLSLPSNVNFHLYGIGYEDQGMENVKYFGSYPPDILPITMEADYGLVWDGDTADTCSGVYGEYLKINNPHKTSLYLASGIPVIIWRKAALAAFVEQEKCGIVIDSLDEIYKKISECSPQQYTEMKFNAKRLSKLLRNGFYTKNVLLQLSF